MPKTVVEKSSFSELKIEKVELFTQGSTKISISVFNIGGCLASCLNFRPFLMLRHLAKTCIFYFKIQVFVTKTIKKR